MNFYGYYLSCGNLNLEVRNPTNTHSLSQILQVFSIL